MSVNRAAMLILMCLATGTSQAEELGLGGNSPQLFVARMKGGDVIEIRAVAQVVYRTRGEIPDPRVPLQVTNQECSFNQSLSVFEAQTVNGEPLAPAELARRLAEPTAVLLLADGEMSPFFVDIFKGDTIVLRYKRLGKGTPLP